MILMRQSLIKEEHLDLLQKVNFLVGSLDDFCESVNNSVPALEPFSDLTLSFLNAVSKELREDKEAKGFSDVVTFGFYIRQASMTKLKGRFVSNDENIYLGRGLAFHIAPSNVPVNYAYSLVTGLVTGNLNVVRVPSKDFPQVSIINRAINKVLSMEEYVKYKKYIYLVRYERNKSINDIFSLACDVRIIWGGDNTIAELRESHLAPRATEITFADRYSLAVINSDKYLEMEDKKRFAEGFYNDTYLSDQNACTSPRLVVFTGSNKNEAKNVFWDELHKIALRKYDFQSIMGVNKLTSSMIFATKYDGLKEVVNYGDNLIVKIVIDEISNNLMDYKDNSGYFFEYDCDDVMDLYDICNDNHCQTIGYLGDMADLLPLLRSGIRGVDRVVPIGKTMDFDFIWDGYNLYERMTRIIKIEEN